MIKLKIQGSVSREMLGSLCSEKQGSVSRGKGGSVYLDFPTYTENRSLTKFDKCPFLSHLLGTKPYLGLGPNDEYSNIHKPNESLSKITIEINYNQTLDLINYYSN